MTARARTPPPTYTPHPAQTSREARRRARKEQDGSHLDRVVRGRVVYVSDGGREDRAEGSRWRVEGGGRPGLGDGCRCAWWFIYMLQLAKRGRGRGRHGGQALHRRKSPACVSRPLPPVHHRSCELAFLPTIFRELLVSLAAVSSCRRLPWDLPLGPQRFHRARPSAQKQKINTCLFSPSVSFRFDYVFSLIRPGLQLLGLVLFLVLISSHVHGITVSLIPLVVVLSCNRPIVFSISIAICSPHLVARIIRMWCLYSVFLHFGFRSPALCTWNHLSAL